VNANGTEAAALCATVAALFAFGTPPELSRRTRLLMAISLVVPLWMCLESLTQFLTVDEQVLLPKMIDADTADEMFGYSVSQLTVGTLGKLGLLLTGDASASYALIAFAKLAHGLIGIAVVAAIFRVVSRHLVDATPPVIVFYVFYPAALTLPVVVLGVKTGNNDLLSMVLGVLSVVLIAAALRREDRALARWAVMTATLAAMEKVTASPIVLVSIAVCGWLATAGGRRSFLHDLYRSARAVLAGLGWSLLTQGVVYAGIVASGRWLRGIQFQLTPSHVARPYTSVLWPLLRALRGAGAEMSVAMNGAGDNRTAGVALGCVAALVVVASASLRTKSAHAVVVGTPSRRRRALLGLLTFVVLAFGVGVVGTYRVVQYQSLVRAVADGLYRPATIPGDGFAHFGAATLAGHVLSHVAFSVAVFINQFPSALVIAPLVLLTLLWRLRITPSPVMVVVLAIGVLTPVLLGLVQAPELGRYMSLYVLLTAVALTIIASELIGRLPSSWRLAAAVVVAGAVLAEVAPFGPLYAPFRPIWSGIGQDEYLRRPVAGETRPFANWLGWGEEIMLAGRRLTAEARRVDAPAETRWLYSTYGGVWLSAHDLEVAGVAYGQLRALDYGSNDFVMVTRATAAGAPPSLFPSDVQPAFVVEFRNYVMAWVFRAADLRQQHARRP